MILRQSKTGVRLPVLRGAGRAAPTGYQIASTHSGWSMNGFRLPW